jgi:hypothetical protein
MAADKMKIFKNAISKVARFCKDLLLIIGVGIAYVAGICFIFSKKAGKIVHKNA